MSITYTLASITTSPLLIKPIGNLGFLNGWLSFYQRAIQISLHMNQLCALKIIIVRKF